MDGPLGVTKYFRRDVGKWDSGRCGKLNFLIFVAFNDITTPPRQIHWNPDSWIINCPRKIRNRKEKSHKFIWLSSIFVIQTWETYKIIFVRDFFSQYKQKIQGFQCWKRDENGRKKIFPSSFLSLYTHVLYYINFHVLFILTHYELKLAGLLTQ